MLWIPLAVCASLGFGFYNFFSKLSVGYMSPTLVLVFMAATSCAIALGATVFLKIAGQVLSFNTSSLLFPILAGLATGIAEIFYLLMFTKQAPLSIATPFVLGATTIVATLLGVFFLNESFSWIKLLGILFTLLGLILLS